MKFPSQKGPPPDLSTASVEVCHFKGKIKLLIPLQLQLQYFAEDVGRTVNTAALPVCRLVKEIKYRECKQPMATEFIRYTFVIARCVPTLAGYNSEQGRLASVLRSPQYSGARQIYKVQWECAQGEHLTLSNALRSLTEEVTFEPLCKAKNKNFPGRL